MLAQSIAERPWFKASYKRHINDGPASSLNLFREPPLNAFRLDPRLAADTLPLGDLPLCRALLMNDARFPWVILVPRRPDLAELHQLAAADRARLWAETLACGAVLAQYGTKVNTGALGNIVRQLHIHVVARQAGDAAWPGPVWGSGPRQPYDPAAAAARIAQLSEALGLTGQNCTHTE